MSLSEVQTDAASLNAEARRKLAAFPTMLRMKETGEWNGAAKSGTPDRSGWVSLDEANQRQH